MPNSNQCPDKSLADLYEDQLAVGKIRSFPLYIICLVVFGGKDLDTRINKYHNAFAPAFYKENNFKCLEPVEAVPPMHACLKSPKDFCEVGQIAMA